MLLVPIVLALPLRFWWSIRVGNLPEHIRYRSWVRQVLDAGEPLSVRRQELDHLARGLPIDIVRQGRIEMDVLHPLKLPHFMLLPVLILSPLVGLIGAILFILLFPLILIAEWILIDRGLLAKIVDVVLRLMHWGIIGIHRLDTGVREEDAMVEHMHRLPTTAFLGLFCYLIVSYMPLPTWLGITFTVLLFLLLTSVIVIVEAASHGELVFADTSQRRLQPMERLVDDILAPVVGLGLLFLLSRQLFLTQIGASNSIFSDPIWFIGIVLMVLYSAAAVAIMVEISFFGLGLIGSEWFSKNKSLNDTTQHCMRSPENTIGMELNPIRSLRQHLEHDGKQTDEQEPFNFEDMLRAPSTLQEGEDAIPPKTPKLKAK